jgi:hypothetical protein
MRVGLDRRLPRVVVFAAGLWCMTHTDSVPARAAASDTQPRVAILQDAALDMDPAIADAVVACLRQAGFATERLSADAVCDPTRLTGQNFRLLVTPDAGRYPIAGAKALTQYLSRGGNLLVVGRSPFDNPLWKYQGRWIDRAWVRQTIAQTQPEQTVFTFDRPGEADGWSRSVKTRQPSRVTVEAGGAAGSAGCLRLDLPMEGHFSDGWSAPLPKRSGKRSGGLLCFWAKGDGRTSQLVVRLSLGGDWRNRGLAVVRLTPEWKYYVLAADDFSRMGHADPFAAVSVGFTLVNLLSLTNAVNDGPHTVWVDQVGLATNLLAKLDDMGQSGLPKIETLVPGYKTYPLSQISSLEPVSGQAIVNADGLALPCPTTAYSCYVRPEGKGFERGYQWRWIPLVRACDAQGVERGTVAWMLLHGARLAEGPAFEDAVQRLAGGIKPEPAPPFEGAVCAVCSITDRAALKRLLKTNLLGDMARRMCDGLFLEHAGAQQFSCWPGEKTQLGAVVVNHGLRRAEVQVRMRVCESGGGKCVFQTTAAVTVAPGQRGRAAFGWTAPSGAGRCYQVRTELWRQEKTIDAIEHGLGILSTAKPRPEEFVTVRDGDFWLEGKKWYPMGVNYWPRYAIALECEDYTYHWLTPGFYNPEAVERDLAQLEAMGATFVCIRAHHQNDRRTLLDFLRRARLHNIRTMVFFQTHEVTVEPHYFQGMMMPYHFQEAACAEALRAMRLPDNPALLGYDLMWEPAGWVFGAAPSMFGWKETVPYRQRWDAAWARWIVERYGSLAQAEADWGMRVPRRGQEPTSPSDKQLREDGPWRVMVAAYRRFMDDLMSRYWNDATRRLKRLDPNHLVSYRQGNLPPIDFTLTATPKHVDFFCMEGYDFRPNNDGENAAGFVNRYVDFTHRGKPYLWVEFGGNVWNRDTMQPDAAAIATQGAAHELIYRVALATGARGATPWWLAGGYRVSERTDFGILNPDGTPRPAGEALQRYAKLFRTPRSYPASNTWLTIDRDAHPGGHWYIAHHEGAAAYQAATAAGKQLGIRTAGTGTTSADTPLVAVGNRPYNGQNPPKYLNAEFNGFKIRVGQGPWIEVRDGGTIRVPQNMPIEAAASVGNLQEATWLTPASCQGRPGAVYLASTAASQLQVKQPIVKDTPYLADADFGPAFSLCPGVAAPTKVELQMTAQGRAWFGERLRFTLLPTAAVR